LDQIRIATICAHYVSNDSCANDRHSDCTYRSASPFPLINWIFPERLCGVGVVVTSASSQILGTLYWNPIQLLAAVQEHYHSSSHGSSICVYMSNTRVYLSCFLSARRCLLRWGRSCLQPTRSQYRAQQCIHRNGYIRTIPAIHQHSSWCLHHGYCMCVFYLH
jgi:hypothetical protein